MKQQNPISAKIQKAQEQLNSELKLVEQKEPFHFLGAIVALLMFAGVLISTIKILFAFCVH